MNHGIVGKTHCANAMLPPFHTLPIVPEITAATTSFANPLKFMSANFSIFGTSFLIVSYREVGGSSGGGGPFATVVDFEQVSRGVNIHFQCWQNVLLPSVVNKDV